MNNLVSIRSNIFYGKDLTSKEEKYNKQHELIFLVDKPLYSFSNEGEVVRERTIEDFRFVLNDETFETLIGLLHKIKDAEPE